MAIAFARLEFVRRTNGKNAVCKAAYLERSSLKFEGTTFGTAQVFDFSHLEKPVFSKVYLPGHVDAKFNDIKTLWNAVEKFEKRKDSQVGMDFVLALPDDKSISLEDKRHLMEKFLHEYFIDKWYGVHAVIHQPDKKNSRVSEENGKLEKVDHNWHCHIFVTPRTFNEAGDNFSPKKLFDLLPSIRGASHYAIDAMKWGKIWTQIQNDFFEEKGLNLRVDHEGVVSQEHLGPVRMRGSKIYSVLEKQDQKIAMNQKLSMDASRVLEKLTEMKSVFTVEDAENYFRKHVSENDLEEVRKNFWKSPEIIELFKNGESQETAKFSTVAVIEEEKKMMRLADRIQDRAAFKNQALSSAEEFKRGLNEEQKVAFDGIVSGQALSCIEGHAGTGKSYLLVSLKKYYEDKGFTVRAFGPDNATVRVLEEKGFKEVTNIHRFLFKNHFSKNSTFSKNEVWIVDESGKLGNKPLLELLKQAEKSGAQIIFSGNSAQLPSVERGGMFKKFCEKYGFEVLVDVQRQKAGHQREISQKLAEGNFKEAINMIATTGGFVWSNDKETSILNLVEKWALDKSHHPYGSQLIIAHINAEVRAINEIAHLYRKSRGEVSEKEFKCETAYGDISVSEGDLIEFRENNVDLGVSNGLTAVLVSASEGKFVLKTQAEEKERNITFDPRKYTSFQLGYATTYCRSQGRGIDRVYALYSKQMNKPSFYVILTRHFRNVHCFVSRTDAKCLSDIKYQAQRENLRESSLDYVTQSEIELQKQSKEMEDRINELSNSGQILDRMKGGYLKAWTSVKSQVHDYVEKVQDRRDAKGFYNVNLSQNNGRKGNVVRVISENLTENGQETLAKLDEGKKNLQSEIQETVLTPKSTLNKLAENQKKIVKEYLEKIDEASSLYSIVKAESASSNLQERETTSFLKWQAACTERNKAAHRLSHSFSPASLKGIFGVKSFEILKDRTEKHEWHIAPKINLGDQLKENLEPLLYKLFPEGPSGRDSRGFRFGAKGSTTVACKGDKIGCYYDFENQKGGNLFQLIQTKLGLNESEAKEWANNFLNNPKPTYFPKQYAMAGFNKAEAQEWISSIPPKEVPVPPLHEISKYLNEKYTLVAKHPYYDKNGNIVQYNLRLQGKEDPKNKTVLPLSFGRLMTSADEEKWGLKKYQFEDGKNPIYNLNLLKENPEKPVLIVEGEKSADVGTRMFDNMVTISWFGGSGSTKKVDWSLLFGREVMIWPDNDQAGFKAAEEISGCLRQVGVKSLNVVDRKMLSKEFPEKWDIADALPKGREVSFLKDCLQRAEQKAVGLDRLSALLNASGKDGKDRLEIQRLNEILWRVDERVRPDIEKEYKSKPWDIENRILSEVSTVLKSSEELLKMASSISSHKSMAESIAFQGMLYQANTGTLPSIDSLEEMKKALVSFNVAINQQSQMDEKARGYAVDKTCAIMIERGLQDKNKINEFYKRSVAESDHNKSIEIECSTKTKANEISIANI